MQELIAHIAKSLVDHPEEVKVSKSVTDDTITLELAVAPDDLGKGIGKQGRTARAMRSILSATAAKEDMRSRLDIVE
ncbi:KH domain-containing protein [Desulfotalea psychrophila]|uniref:RNA-binding protein KhpA n=1 Tax=Desulfotalea psychrophila (strain LSv54 / DSM 12343) TaxID=177439 RepID=Q6AJF0_DESPS|nr:KH domain-containing protein [Desulfotalea psychrophila]CAG37530.1 conserved hypothetical protein [Desulfotalea psychrophila LSv54]